MLIWFVVIYLLVSISIGLYAATRVHNTKDYAVAGRSLPLYIVTATVFATWLGAETVLGISATFTKEGLRGVVADPFGSSLCLILVGLFFARKLYRMNICSPSATITGRATTVRWRYLPACASWPPTWVGFLPRSPRSGWYSPC
ncbi:MAG: sodium:solute symporter family transporter [Sulfuricella sp.]